MGSQSKARCRLEAYLPMMILKRLGLLTQFSTKMEQATVYGYRISR
ncbi:Uncharacterised protein [Chlamydia trachomatis]|nr:Uncharacterised protein [Chlamydia trachomatis]